jgi:hypothetical protein
MLILSLSSLNMNLEPTEWERAMKLHPSSWVFVVLLTVTSIKISKEVNAGSKFTDFKGITY